MSNDGGQPRTPLTLRLSVLGSLYLAQGLTWGLVSAVLVPMFAEAGMPLTEQAGILVVGTVPWALKVGWAPALDRFGGVGSGNQRRWIVVGQLAMGASVLGMGLLEDPLASVGTFALLWFLHNLFMSLQDVATDALAVDILRKDERGRGNAIMLGGHALGVFVGSFVLAKLMAHTGLGGAILLDAALVMMLAPVVLLVPRGDLSLERGSPRPFVDQLRTAFARRAAWVGLGLATVLLAGDAALSAVASDFLVTELGYPSQFLWENLTPADLVAQLVGFAVTAAIIERIGHRRIAVWAGIALAALWAAFVGLQDMWTAFSFILAFTVVQALCTAPFRAGLHAFLMDLTDPSVRATQFAVFMAALNLGRALGGSVAPGVVGSVGFSGLFLAAAGYQVAVVLLLAAIGGRLAAEPGDARS